ncbi:MAG: hypothetical protein LBI69_03385 [Puniceicoccales bacterium]|nr:hypothetical protein [Puniceicoccales bacterium]
MNWPALSRFPRDKPRLYPCAECARARTRRGSHHGGHAAKIGICIFDHSQMALERAAMGKLQIFGKDPGISKIFRKNGKMSQQADADAAGKMPLFCIKQKSTFTFILFS